MSQLSVNYGSVQTPTFTAALNALAAGNYATSSAIDNTSVKPIDLLVTLNIMTGASVGGNKQISIFAVCSPDGTNFDTANASATDNSRDGMIKLIDTIPTPNAGEALQRSFNISQAFNGILPPAIKLIVKNDSGAALANSGNALTYKNVLLNNT